MKQTPITKLPAFDSVEEQWNVVVETPRGSRHKFKYLPLLGVFSLHKTLPEGMAFPYDFGFLPRTRGPDGDPLDVLLVMEEGSFAGCLVKARLVGVMEAVQTEKGGEKTRNDRLVAVAATCPEERCIHSIKDFSAQMMWELEQFFVSYNRIEGKKFQVLRVRGPGTAGKVAREGMRAFRRQKK